MSSFLSRANNIPDNVLQELVRPGIGTRALDSTLDVLGTAGKILDTPASVIRGLLAGEPGRALSGIFDTAKRVSGSELIGQGSNNFTWSGLGTEILLDPLTYLSGGLTTAGKLASRAEKLTALSKVLQVSKAPGAGKRLYDIYSQIPKVASEQLSLGRDALETLASTKSAQAKLGQRAALQIGLPFAEKIPILAGESYYKGLEKLGSLTKTIPGVDRSLDAINKLFNTEYGYSPLEKAIKSEKRISEREAEVSGALLQKELQADIHKLATANNIPYKDAEVRILDLVEDPNLDRSFRYTTTKQKIPGLEYLKSLQNNIPKDFLDVAFKFKTLHKQLLDEGIAEGLPVAKLDSKLGYANRLLTPQARQYLADSDSISKELTKVLEVGIPGFARQRTLFTDSTITAINKKLKDKLKVDFDFFSTDIATNTAYRVIQQKKALSRNNVLKLAFDLLGQEKSKGKVDLAKLLRSNRNLLTKLELSKVVPVWSKYNIRAVVDENGKIVLKSTNESSANTLKFLQNLREIRRDAQEGANAFTDETIIKNLAAKYGIREDQVDNIIKDFNITNYIYHGTSEIPVQGIQEVGHTIGKVPDPDWASKLFIKSKPATYFSPDYSTAKDFAKGVSESYPGALEHERSSKRFIDFILEQTHTDPIIRNYLKNTQEFTIIPGTGFSKGEVLSNIADRLRKAYKLTPDQAKIEAEEIYKKFGDNLNKYSIDPVVLKTKLSDLMKYNLLHEPVQEHILKAISGRGKESGLKALFNYPVSRGTQDVTSLPQVMTKDVPTGLLKPVLGNAKDKTLGGKQINLGRQVEFRNKIATFSNKEQSLKYVRKQLKDAGITERYVDKQTFNHLEDLLTITKDPAALKPFTKLWDNVNSLYKAALTQLFPAFHVRNAMSGVFMNSLAGVVNPKYWAQSIAKLKNLTPEERIYLTSIGVLGEGQHENLWRLIQESDVGKTKLTRLFAPGRKLGIMVDDINRLAHFYGKKAAGLSDHEAADSVIKYLFDYSDLTNFEKRVPKRLFLFYTFIRKNIPLMLRSLAENPQFVQGYNRLVGHTKNSDTRPQWMSDVINFGDTQVGLGMPIEDISRFGTEGEGLGKFARMFYSMFAPGITVPTELVTNQSLYTGEAFEGSRLKNILQHSPLSRFATTYDRFNTSKDIPEQVLKLLTGIRVTHLSPEDIAKQNRIKAIKNKLEDISRSGGARRLEIYTKPRDGEPDPRLNLLNKLLSKSYE